MSSPRSLLADTLKGQKAVPFQQIAATTTASSLSDSIRLSAVSAGANSIETQNVYRTASNPPAAPSTIIAIQIKVNSKVHQVIREALEAALDSRDFLGHQLAHALGEFDDETYNALEDKYFALMRRWSPEELRERIGLLYEVIPERIDSDVLSTLLRCDLADVQNIFQPNKPKPSQLK